MAYQVTSDAGSLIMTLDEAKNHLRVEINDDDTLITALIHVAREKIETYCNVSLTDKTIQEYWDAFPESVYQRPNGEFLLTANPVKAITSIEYYDDPESDTLTTVNSSFYVLDNVSKYARVAPKIGYTWPLSDGRINGVKITYTVGYTTIPTPMIQAAKLMIGDWYERREDRNSQLQSTGFIVPKVSEMLLKPYRIYQWS